MKTMEKDTYVTPDVLVVKLRATQMLMQSGTFNATRNSYESGDDNEENW